jgi:acetyl esterase/lipase
MAKPLCLLLTAVLGVALAQEPTPPATIHENVVYGSVGGVDLHLDVFEPSHPAATDRAAVLLIHGGGWTSNDKSTMRGMAQFLARAGYVGFAVDYRLFNGTENRWPAQLEDVERAVRWIRAHAADYHVDPKRIGAFGHSAGAQLAALLGMEDTGDAQSSRIQAVVDVSGPIDFTTEHDADDVAFLTSFLGSKEPSVLQKASPAFHVSKNASPFLIVHGTKDQDVPMAQSEELFAKLQAAGVPVSLVKVDDEHTFQTPEARRKLAFETLGFFNRYLAAAK